jgi:hypothetical protein
VAEQPAATGTDKHGAGHSPSLWSSGTGPLGINEHEEQIEVEPPNDRGEGRRSRVSRADIVPDDLPAMDVEERANRLTELFPRAPLGAHLGMTLHYDAEHRTVVEVGPGEHLNHALGEVHGGVIATLIDTAAWSTAAAQYDTWLGDRGVPDPAAGTGVR